MCSLVVSVLDSPAVDPRSNPGSGSALLMSEKSQAVTRLSADFGQLPRNAYTIAVQSGHQYRAL